MEDQGGKGRLQVSASNLLGGKLGFLWPSLPVPALGKHGVCGPLGGGWAWGGGGKSLFEVGGVGGRQAPSKNVEPGGRRLLAGGG